MTTIETISILITTYNRSHCLNELLHRLNTMFSVELKAGTTEILVFNDASTDNTETICVNYQDRIRYFSTPHNVGLIEARRRLIDAANGEYLVSLDDDSCFVDLDALDTIREAFEQYPTCAVLAANVAVPKTPGGQAPLDYVPFKAPGFIGCGHVLRSSAVKDIGSYPQFLKGYGAEETILTLRLFEGGYDVIFLPHLRVYHGEDWSNRPIIQERASKFSNEIAVMIYAYPWYWILPGIAKKFISHTKFNIRHNTLSAMVFGIKQLLPKTINSFNYRHPIRNQTLQQLFALRKSFQEKTMIWRNEGLIPEVWPETKTMFLQEQSVNINTKS